MGRNIQNIKESTYASTRGIMKTVIHSLLVSFAVSLPQGYYYPYYPYSYPVYQVVQPNIYTSQIRYLGIPLESQSLATQQIDRKINVEEKVKEVLGTTLPTDPSIKAPNDLSSPSAAAALAYMKSVSKDELCGLPTEVYLKTIFDGKSKEEANAEATRIYIEAYNSGKRLPQSGACAAADAAYREAWRKGDDPILESALAFINAWPGAKEGNPCAVSGIDYMKAIINGKSHLEANTIAMTAFANAFKELSKQGKPLKDVACRDATKAFFEAIPEKPDPANAAAFYAFTDKIFEDGAPAFDPVCLSSESLLKDQTSLLILHVLLLLLLMPMRSQRSQVLLMQLLCLLTSLKLLQDKEESLILFVQQLLMPTLMLIFRISQKLLPMRQLL